jgi:hypothetical protein
LVSLQAAAAQLFAFGDNCLGLFRSCEIVDVKNYVIAQILNASHYYAVMNRAETSYVDYLANGMARDGAGSTVSLGSYNGIQKRWTVATTTITYSTYLRPSADPAASPPPAIYALDIPNSPAELLASANNSALVIRVQIPLRVLFRNCFAAQDKYLYFGQNMTIKLNFNLSTSMAFIATGNVIASTYAVYTGSATITDLQLFACVSRNEQVNNEIKAAVKAGNFSILTGWVRADSLAGPTAAISRQIQLQYSNVDGKRLVKTYVVPFNKTTGFDAAADVIIASVEQYKHSLLSSANAVGGPGAPTSYNTTLDTQPLQSTIVDLGTNMSQAWVQMQELYEGSLINSALALQLHFQHVDNFSDQRCLWSQDLSVETGVPLQSQSSSYAFQGVFASGLTDLYCFSVFQRELLIREDGCQWM